MINPIEHPEFTIRILINNQDECLPSEH
jgi:hypothetical protein